MTVRVELEHEDDGSARAWIDGAVGDDRVRFLLDTGASRCRVPYVDATAALTVHGTDEGVGAAGVSLGEDEVVLPALTIGERVIRDVPATRAAPGATTMPLLGMSALGRSTCEFRLADGIVELHDTPPDRAWLPFAGPPADQPMIEVDIGGVPVRACWDTGAGLSAFDVAFAAAHPELFERRGESVGFDSAGVALGVELAQVAAMRAGTAELAASGCVIVDFSPLNARAPVPLVAVLGLPVVLQADWWFDGPGRRWSVNPR